MRQSLFFECLCEPQSQNVLALALEYTSECSKDSIHSKYDHMLQKASIVEMSCSLQAVSLATPHPGIAKVFFGLYKDLSANTHLSEAVQLCFQRERHQTEILVSWRRSKGGYCNMLKRVEVVPRCQDVPSAR